MRSPSRYTIYRQSKIIEIIKAIDAHIIHEEIIAQEMNSLYLDWQRRTRKVASFKRKNKSKKKEVTPQQALVILGSVIIILMALGGLSLVFNLYS
jgi:hypothetical protein